MRFLLATAAALAVAATALPAASQTPVGVPSATPSAPNPYASLTESQAKRREALMGEGWQYRTAPLDAATLAAMRAAEGPPAADLSNIDLRIKADEASMTRLRDSELARESAVLLSIEPGRPYGRYQTHFDPNRYLVSIDPWLKSIYNGITAIPDRIF